MNHYFETGGTTMKTLLSILTLAIMFIAGEAVSAVPDTTTLVRTADNSTNLATPFENE